VIFLENYKTIKELADELNVSKQAVWQKIKRNKSIDLRKFMTTKGNTVYVDVDGQTIIIEMFDSSYKEKKANAVDEKIDDIINVDDNKKLLDEVQFLRNLVDKLQSEKSELHKIVDQQQQLTLQSNKQIETLQQQLLLSNQSDEKEEETSDTIETPEEQSETLEETVHEEIKSESKKWWQLWK